MKKLRLLTVLSFIVGCLIGLTCCKKPTLDAPDIETFKVNETTLVLTWEAIDDAKSYKIMVNTDEYNSKKPSYPMADLAAGVYTITVKAVSADENVLDSEWSQSFTYERESESGLTYALINNKTEYEVRGLGSATGDIVVDATYRGKPVTKIADMAFANKSKDVYSVTIGENIKTIGARAFYNCSNMSQITFKADNVTSIGAYAFQGCRSLKEFTVPSQVTSISNYMFAYCRSLEKVNFNQSITSIGERAFSNCDKLDNVVVPDTVTSIGLYAFADNIGMTNIDLGDGVTTLAEYTFLNCESLTTITFGEGLKNIDQFAFSKCVALTSIDLPDTVVSIGEGAFHSCENLAEVDLSDNLEKMGAVVFAGTKLWTEAPDGIVVVDGWIVGRNGKEIGETVLSKNGVIADGIIGIAERSFQVSEDFTALGIPDSVKYIGVRAFYNSKLTNLSIGKGVEVIGEKAFAYCPSLTSISLPDSLEALGASAFDGCRNLKSVSLPKSLKSIESGTFYACCELSSINIPENLGYIDEFAFAYCISLENFTLSARTIINQYAFFEAHAGRMVS